MAQAKQRQRERAGEAHQQEEEDRLPAVTLAEEAHKVRTHRRAHRPGAIDDARGRRSGAGALEARVLAHVHGDGGRERLGRAPVEDPAEEDRPCHDGLVVRAAQHSQRDQRQEQETAHHRAPHRRARHVRRDVTQGPGQEAAHDEAPVEHGGHDVGGVPLQASALGEVEGQPQEERVVHELQAHVADGVKHQAWHHQHLEEARVADVRRGVQHVAIASLVVAAGAAVLRLPDLLLGDLPIKRHGLRRAAQEHHVDQGPEQHEGAQGVEGDVPWRMVLDQEGTPMKAEDVSPIGVRGPEPKDGAPPLLRQPIADDRHGARPARGLAEAFHDADGEPSDVPGIVAPKAVRAHEAFDHWQDGTDAHPDDERPLGPQHVGETAEDELANGVGEEVPCVHGAQASGGEAGLARQG
mmetsp:Transcript_65553/g.211443  ORF Transcript_65553/g.211443 Transcript_65553/m.211443 type:complete len:410 (+) Transcript_65553:576-1805(+)